KEVSEFSLPIEFVGTLDRKDVFEYYSNSILIFPSFIETVGLPLMEAKMHKGVIIASDCQFSREILKGYENAYFFSHDSSNKLFKILFQFISREVVYNTPSDMPKQMEPNGFGKVIALLKSK
ncbi:glycosyltransferase, partial [Bacillus sp. JJ1764]|uniref:glycosyltransferase n=1 Tax=Bacillus sp. JJ1764 TaxID=3122964 RepID=UPI002FFF0A7D